jgi:hypothetical protein
MLGHQGLRLRVPSLGLALQDQQQAIVEIAPRDRFEQIPCEAKLGEPLALAADSRRCEQHEARRSASSIVVDAPTQFCAVHAWHLMIDESNFERLTALARLAHRRKRGVGAANCRRLYAAACQLSHQHLAVRCIVIDDQDATVP